jgi:hypothetical protein
MAQTENGRTNDAYVLPPLLEIWGAMSFVPLDDKRSGRESKEKPQPPEVVVERTGSMTGRYRSSAGDGDTESLGVSCSLALTAGDF